jgi:F-type H+-transporting ATPase subunit epsilon
MAHDFRLSVVAPDRSVVEETVTSVIAPGANGYLGVMAGHVPLIAALRPGVLEYLDGNNQRHYVHVGGGFAEVTPTRVTILADEAERAQDIDVAKAEEVLERARRALRGEHSDMTTGEAVLEMDRALNRVRAARLVNR